MEQDFVFPVTEKPKSKKVQSPKRPIKIDSSKVSPLSETKTETPMEVSEDRHKNAHLPWKKMWYIFDAIMEIKDDK
jgi:hypothetical protein